MDVERTLDSNPLLGGKGDVLVVSNKPLSRDDTEFIKRIAGDCNPPVELCFWAKNVAPDGEKAIHPRGQKETKEERAARLEKLESDFQAAFTYLGPFKTIVFLSFSFPAYFDDQLKSWLPAEFQVDETRLVAFQTPEVKEREDEEVSDFSVRKEARREEFQAFFCKQFDRSYVEPEEVESPDQTFRQQLAEHHATLAAARPPKTVAAKASATKRKATTPVPASQPLLKKFFASKS